MLNKGRWKGALIMGAVWTVAIAVTFFLLSDSYSDSMLIISLFVSLLLMVLGLVVYFGGYMLLAGVNTMPKEERSKLNMDEITSFMGVFLVLMSYVAFLMVFYFVMVVVFVAAVFVMIVYINVSKRFRADTQTKA